MFTDKEIKFAQSLHFSKKFLESKEAREAVMEG